jgi:hypothetical protein
MDLDLDLLNRSLLHDSRKGTLVSLSVLCARLHCTAPRYKAGMSSRSQPSARSSRHDGRLHAPVLAGSARAWDTPKGSARVSERDTPSRTVPAPPTGGLSARRTYVARHHAPLLPLAAGLAIRFSIMYRHVDILNSH